MEVHNRPTDHEEMLTRQSNSEALRLALLETQTGISFKVNAAGAVLKKLPIQGSQHPQQAERGEMPTWYQEQH